MKLPSFKIISAGIWVVFCLILSISFAFANNIYILQSGDSVDLNVTQDGQNNEIEGLNGSGYAIVYGANSTATFSQTGDNNQINLSQFF